MPLQWCTDEIDYVVNQMRSKVSISSTGIMVFHDEMSQIVAACYEKDSVPCYL